MPAPRFYCPLEIPSNGLFMLDSGVRHHAFRVLRLEKGDEIFLFDGNGSEARCRIRDASSVEVMQKNAVDRESKIAIHLVQALVSTEKTDWVVQKAVELGAKSVQIVETRRGVVKLSADRAKKREAHWMSVAVSACEQCG
ncbi:MAG TPA: RsmE family RNA methyltransferase, partial [Burkholderiales bacterium]|nr:RsmE family RNA methyltransferase [Burkholderiales bacterium]